MSNSLRKYENSDNNIQLVDAVKSLFTTAGNISEKFEILKIETNKLMLESQRIQSESERIQKDFDLEMSKENNMHTEIMHLLEERTLNINKAIASGDLKILELVVDLYKSLDNIRGRL
ncbi:MAG: hypothetical protein NXI00_02945 [Cytophagales bacterium]|nr:hypothetical protein [Cytophagales bacterium]